MRKTLLGELSAEFAVSMILILFGCGVVAQVVTTPDGSLGDHDSIPLTGGTESHG
jgi:glycerol uptake facilitator protein